jgi:hypothetical protein
MHAWFIQPMFTIIQIGMVNEKLKMVINCNNIFFLLELIFSKSLADLIVSQIEMGQPGVQLPV